MQKLVFIIKPFILETVKEIPLRNKIEELNNRE